MCTQKNICFPPKCIETYELTMERQESCRNHLQYASLHQQQSNYLALLFLCINFKTQLLTGSYIIFYIDLQFCCCALLIELQNAHSCICILQSFGKEPNLFKMLSLQNVFISLIHFFTNQRINSKFRNKLNKAYMMG